MKNFERLSKDEMKMVVGGGEKVCRVETACYIPSYPYGEFGWCATDVSNGCHCHLEDSAYENSSCMS